jgi:hypothetical protein
VGDAVKKLAAPGGGEAANAAADLRDRLWHNGHLLPATRKPASENSVIGLWVEWNPGSFEVAAMIDCVI